MRRLLALSALAATTVLSAPAAHAQYTCLPEEEPRNGVCVQVIECGHDYCFVAPGVQFHCYLGFRGETVCRVVRALSFEVAGR